MSGYVRIHRSLLGHPAFRNESETMAFAWLIAKAAWKRKKVRYKGHDIILERGQLTISIRDFAAAMDRPKGWVERLFARLREHGMIAQKNRTQVGTQVGTHGGTIGGTPADVITICNYADFQGDDAGPRTPRRTVDETDAGQQPDTEQEREELKNSKKVSSVSKDTSPRAWSKPGKGCEYTVHPRSDCTPEVSSPPKRTTLTPEAASDKPSRTINTSEAKASSVTRARFAAPVGVPDEVWSDFLASPKRRKAGMSATAYRGIESNLKALAEHGFPPGEMIAMAVERGWTTVKLEWVQNERQSRTNTMGRHQSADGLSSTARAAIAVFGK